MRKLFSIAIAGMLFTQTTFAQATKELNIDGLKVILRTTPKDVISARLMVRGGTANYSKEKEGIETLAFGLAVQGGTKTLDKVAFNDAAEKIGTSFASSSQIDYGDMNMTCLKPFWDKSWDLFADAIMNPAFDAKEFDLQKEQALSSAKQQEGDPDGYLRILAMSETFKGRNYAKRPEGSAESLQKLTIDDVKKYYAETVGKKRCFLVIVGNISEAEVTAKVKASIAKMDYGTPAPIENKLLITKGSETIVDRDMATNYLMGIMSAPSLAMPDGINMDLAMNILYDRFFVELRTKRSLSYAPSAGYNRAATTSPYSYVYISTTDPKKALDVMVMLLDSVKRSGFTDKELKDNRQGYLTNYYQKLETSSAQSSALGRSEATGSWKIDETFSDKVNAATLKDVNRTFNKYTAAIKWTYLGKKDAVQKEDFKQTKHIPVLESPY